MSDYRQLEKDAQDEIAGHEITCDPAAVLALLADKARLERFVDEYSKSLDQLKVENESLRKTHESIRPLIKLTEIKREGAPSQFDLLRKDAERYRFLRDDVSAGQVDLCIISKHWKSNDCTYLSLDQADYAIDVAMEKVAK
jgi:hypothetical protein